MRRFVSEDPTSAKLSVTVRSLGLPDEIYISLDEVKALRNPQASPIRSIVMHASSPTAMAQIQIQSSLSIDFAAIRVFAHHDSQDRASRLEADMRLEASNSRDKFNNWHRWSIDSLLAWCVEHRRRFEIAWWAFLFALFTLVIVSSVVEYRRSLQTTPPARKEAVSQVEVTPKATLSPSEEARAQELRREYKEKQDQLAWKALVNDLSRIGFWVIVIVLFFAIVSMYIKMYPRVVFLIGEGQKRLDQVSKYRHLVMVTLLGSGLVMPLIRSWLVSVIAGS